MTSININSLKAPIIINAKAAPSKRRFTPYNRPPKTENKTEQTIAKFSRLSLEDASASDVELNNLEKSLSAIKTISEHLENSKDADVESLIPKMPKEVLDLYRVNKAGKDDHSIDTLRNSFTEVVNTFPLLKKSLTKQEHFSRAGAQRSFCHNCKKPGHFTTSCWYR